MFKPVRRNIGKNEMFMARGKMNGGKEEYIVREETSHKQTAVLECQMILDGLTKVILDELTDTEQLAVKCNSAYRKKSAVEMRMEA